MSASKRKTADTAPPAPSQTPIASAMEDINHAFPGVVDGDEFIERATGGRARSRHELNDPELEALVIAAAEKLPLRPDKRLELIPYTAGCSLFKLEQLIEALNKHASRLDVFVFARRIVEPARSPLSGFEFVPLNEDAFAARLGQAIAFSQVRDGPVKLTPCPADLRRALFGQTHRLGSITVRRVATTPIWRAGVLHASPGFNPKEQTWIESPVVTLPTKCDRSAAEGALRYLSGWLGEVAFDTEQDRSVALAAMLSAALRASMRTPGVIVSKPDKGSGASWLTSLIHIVLAGSKGDPIDTSQGQEETDKRIDTALMQGNVSLVLDNVTRDSFNSIPLAQAITADTLKIRRYGRNDDAPVVECTQLILVNGNAVTISDDLSRRFIRCDLNTRLENPSAKQYGRNGDEVLEDAKRERAKLLAAAYTIVTAYQRSGERVSVRPLVGFQRWCETVPAALVWLGLPDPTQSQERIREEDQSTRDVHSLIRLWHTLLGEQRVTACDLVNARNAHSGFPEGTGREDTEAQKQARGDLTELLQQMARDRRNEVTALTLGNRLKKLVGRCADLTDGGRYEIVKAGLVHDNANTWRLRRVQPGESRPSPVSSPGNTARPTRRSKAAPNVVDAVSGKAASPAEAAPVAAEKDNAGESVTVSCGNTEQAKAVRAWFDRRGRSATLSAATVIVPVWDVADRESLLTQLQAEFGGERN